MEIWLDFPYHDRSSRQFFFLALCEFYCCSNWDTLFCALFFPMWSIDLIFLSSLINMQWNVIENKYLSSIEKDELKSTSFNWISSFSIFCSHLRAAEGNSDRYKILLWFELWWWLLLLAFLCLSSPFRVLTFLLLLLTTIVCFNERLHSIHLIVWTNMVVGFLRFWSLVLYFNHFIAEMFD